MLAQILTWKHDQPIVYASTLLNSVEKNYSTIKREALAMEFALHKFRHYLLGNNFVFYVDHMALVYLINKPQVSWRIARWLLLFLEYEFIIVYKPCYTHVVANAPSKLLNTTNSIGVPNQITDVVLFMLQQRLKIISKQLSSLKMITRWWIKMQTFIMLCFKVLKFFLWSIFHIVLKSHL
jgi:hypothetical protein